MTYEREGTHRPPTHPGEVIRMELDELDMTVTAAAERLATSRPNLSALMNGKRSVSPEMALKLGRFFGNGPGLWMNMQTRYDRWTVEHDPDAVRAADEVEPVHV